MVDLLGVKAGAKMNTVDLKTASVEFERLSAEQGWNDHYSQKQLKTLKDLYTTLRTNRAYNQTESGALYWTNAFAERKGWIFKDPSLLEKNDLNTEEMLGLIKLVWAAQTHPQYGAYFKERMEDAYHGDALRYVLDSLKTAVQQMGVIVPDLKKGHRDGEIIDFAEWADPKQPQTKYYSALRELAIKTLGDDTGGLLDRLRGKESRT